MRFGHIPIRLKLLTGIGIIPVNNSLLTDTVSFYSKHLQLPFTILIAFHSICSGMTKPLQG